MLFQCFREFLFSHDPTIFHYCPASLASVTVFFPVFVPVFVTWQRNREIPYVAPDSGANSGTALPQHPLNPGADSVPVFAPVLVHLVSIMSLFLGLFCFISILKFGIMLCYYIDSRPFWLENKVFYPLENK